MANETGRDLTAEKQAPEDRGISARVKTTCCVVGAGPAGTVLAYLLARESIPVTLLEAHADFDRDFRGDTLHPAILEVLDQVGLADKLLSLPHTKIRTVTLPTSRGPVRIADLGRLRTRFPYITMMPQARFLEFLTTEAARFPSFRLEMTAQVRELVRDASAGVGGEGGSVRGVRYQSRDGLRELRADLVVGADGRFSALRRLSGLPPAIATSPPMDVVWFRLPRRADDPTGLITNLGSGPPLVLLDRGQQWQVGYIIPKGAYQEIRAAGLEVLRGIVAQHSPLLAGRVSALESWHQVSLLSVSSDRLPRWHRPGLLLIGDAAHVMSPIGGIGINYAVQDAVAAANLLAEPLQAGSVSVRDLSAVQRRREWPTRLTQAVVNRFQSQVLGRALAMPDRARPPTLLRILARAPLASDLAAKWLAFGLLPEHVQTSGKPRPMDHVEPAA